MAKRDYYEVLGIGKNASDDEIKKAFRRLAIQHHPDKEGGDETKFKEINEAYEVLKDPSKRQRYDQFGHAGVGGSAASDGNPFAGFGGGGGQNVNFDFGDLGFGDVFESFFGGNAVTLKVPAGIDDGATIRLREHGEAIASGAKGDLYVSVRVRAHKKFTRESDLILSAEHVGMVEAALGTEIDVETVDGPVRMKIPSGTQSGTDFKLSGHGVPHLRGGGRGAHIVTVIVDTPTKLSKQQKDLLDQFHIEPGKRGWFS